MLVEFAKEDLESRQKTLFYDEEGKLLYWGIYDFAYKYRDRIFDPHNNEAGYVQKNIAADNLVEYFDGSDQLIAELHKTADGIYLKYDGKQRPLSEVFTISDGKLQVNDEKDLLIGIMSLYGLIEIER